MIHYTKASSIEELHQILELQKSNLPVKLSDKEKRNEGFVTVHHTIDLLQKMNDACAHTIAKNNNKVIGYALSMAKEFGDKIEVLKPMFKELENLNLEDNYLVMGQICVAKEYRKKGVFRSLYNFMKTEVCKDKFNQIITEIDETNTRSINAHKSVGFKKLHSYMSNNQKWVVVALKC